MDLEAGYEVEWVQGQTLEHLILFALRGKPQKLLGKLGDGRMFHAWLSFGGAFWDELTEEDYALVCDDYDGHEPVMIDREHGLDGKVIRQVRAWGHAGPLGIEIEFEHGTLRLLSADASARECRWCSSSEGVYARRRATASRSASRSRGSSLAGRSMNPIPYRFFASFGS